MKKKQSLSLSQLAEVYSVSLKTLKKWLLKVPNLNIEKGRRILTPKEVELILNHLGEPD